MDGYTYKKGRLLSNWLWGNAKPSVVCHIYTVVIKRKHAIPLLPISEKRQLNEVIVTK